MTRPLGMVAAVRLVAGREIRMKLRSKAFLIATGVLMLLVVAAVVVGGIAGSSESTTKVAATGAAIEQLRAVPGLEVTEASDAASAEELVRSGEVEAAVIPDPSTALGLTVVALEAVPGGLVQLLSVSPSVELLEPPTQNPFLAYLAAIGFGIIFFVSAMTFGMTIAQSVVEEKQTRIIEILMSTVPVRALLAGKILGNSALAFGQILAIGGLAAIGMAATRQELLLGDIGPALAWFVVFFLFGFVLLAAIYSATAALVSRQEDVGTATAPATYLVMIPYFLVIFFFDNPLVLGIMSYVPFSAPVGMPMRVFLGSAEWWEPLVSLAVLLVSTALVVLLGARMYSNSLLRTGARVRLREALGSR
ncbi:ABC transporter permease [Ruicaihuangia caeni]|uniref:ABC transporter permease n=1 Tax=Ruicaihuangia caeni TaxID=3042517 RepID=UPI00338DA77E